MIISLSGKGGSGKSTIAKALAEKLCYTYVGIGAMRRKVAESMGLNILQFDELGNKPENVREFDLKYEEYQKSLSLNDNIVIDARLGFYCQPKSFKIYLTIDDKVAAQRIFDNKRTTDHYASVEEVLQKTQQRAQENKIRYQKLYGVDISDVNNFDLVFDTTGKAPEQVVEDIVEEFDKFQKDKNI